MVLTVRAFDASYACLNHPDSYQKTNFIFQPTVVDYM